MVLTGGRLTGDLHQSQVIMPDPTQEAAGGTAAMK